MSLIFPLVAQPSQPSLSWLDLLSIVTGITSVVLGIVAIWQAIVFYRMSTTAQTGAEKALADTSAAVERLDQLYNRLYGDLFSITRDTVTDMRKHVWSTSPIVEETAVRTQQKIEERVDSVKERLDGEMSSILQRVGTFDEQISQLRQELQPVIEKAVDLGRQADEEVRSLTIREFILATLDAAASRDQQEVTADELIYRSGERFRTSDMIVELRSLRDQGIVAWDIPTLEPQTRIRRVN